MQVFIVALLVAVTSAAYIAPLYKKENPIPGSYIVKIKDDFDVDQVASSLQSLISSDGFINKRFRTVIKGLSVRLNSRALSLVQRMDAVEYIEEDGLVELNELWGLDRIDQRALPLDNNAFTPSGTGKGVTIYVIDSGINVNHNDIAGRASVGYDAVMDDQPYGSDCTGHGSHCAGTIGGTKYGVAKEVNLVGVRVFGCRRRGSESDIIDGIDWVAENAVLPAVASLSLGGPASLAMDDATTSLIKNGITVSVAAGNEDQDACNVSPARLSSAITVGAIDKNDERSVYTSGESNFGPCVDIFAPGSDIVSIGHEGSTGIAVKGGTSMACPHVSGAAALILQDDPTLSPALVKATILAKATRGELIEAGINRNELGEGSPNVLLHVD